MDSSGSSRDILQDIWKLRDFCQTKISLHPSLHNVLWKEKVDCHCCFKNFLYGTQSPESDVIGASKFQYTSPQMFPESPKKIQQSLLTSRIVLGLPNNVFKWLKRGSKWTSRHDICPKFYTTGISGQTFYSANMCNLQHCSITARKCIKYQ